MGGKNENISVILSVVTAFGLAMLFTEDGPGNFVIAIPGLGHSLRKFGHDPKTMKARHLSVAALIG